MAAWYCTKGRHEEGKKALRRLIGKVEGFDVDHEYSVLAYETKKSKALADAAGSSGWKALRTKTNLKRCIVATLPFTFQNVCGVPLMFGMFVLQYSSHYCTDILRLHCLLLPASWRQRSVPGQPHQTNGSGRWHLDIVLHSRRSRPTSFAHLWRSCHVRHQHSSWGAWIYGAYFCWRHCSRFPVLTLGICICQLPCSNR